MASTDSGIENEANVKELNLQLLTLNIELARSAVREIPYNKSLGSFTICDYGGGDGEASFDLMLAMIDEIKTVHGKDSEISIIYDDIPCNNFEGLFHRVQGTLVPADVDFPLAHTGVMTFASGTSFFKQCCPTASLHFGCSSLAVHWMSKILPPFPDTFSVHLTTEKQLKAQYAAQASQDWATFLCARAKELAPGGHLVLSSLAVDDLGQFYGHTNNIKRSYFSTLVDLWRGMAEDGWLTQEEFVGINFNEYYRTEKEFRAPFDDKTSRVYKAGLRIQSCDIKLVRSPYHVQWMKIGDKDDKEMCNEHARRYVQSVLKWSAVVIKNSLNSSRSDEQKTELISELYRRYETLVANNPSEHGADWVGAVVHICKI